MSGIDILIQEYCSDGVEYRSFGDVATIVRGASPRPIKNFITQESDGIHWIKIGDVKPGSKFITEASERITPEGAKKSRLVQPGSFVLSNSMSFGRPYILKIEGCIHDGWLAISDFEDYFIPDFLYHLLTSNKYQQIMRQKASSGGAVQNLNADIVRSIELPIVPVPVQREIIRILDQFAELTVELTGELTKELTARAKQYEYYRDELLKPKAETRMVTLGELATDIYRGSGIKRDQVTEDGIPCVRYGEIYTTYNTWFDECVSHTQLEYVPSPKYFEHGDILFAITGESVEDIAKSVAYVGHERCLAGGDIVVLKHNQNPRYLAHVLATKAARDQKSKGKVKSKVVHTSVPSIEKIIIPLPPLDVQKRYADVLDNFEAICTELNICLPAEIEARKKQYEFYRDQLLTFAETGKTILTDRQTDEYNALIKVCQYVFGFANVKLSDIATVSRGGSFQKKDFCDEGVPCIHYGQIYTHYGISATKTIQCISESVAKMQKKAVTNDIVMAVTSENVEDVCKCVAWLGDEDVAVSGHTAIIHHNQNAKYLSHFFHSSLFFAQKKRLAHGVKVIEVTPDKLMNVVIPLPSVQEQERIVSVLDRFDALCADIASGLPAEIEVRRKQYEYYRDKLLTFTEKDN